jgi:hypothetical protein
MSSKSSFDRIRQALEEQPEVVDTFSTEEFHKLSRRAYITFAAGVLAGAGGFGALLPEGVLRRNGLPDRFKNVREQILKKAIRVDDAVAAGIYSEGRASLLSQK